MKQLLTSIILIFATQGLWANSEGTDVLKHLFESENAPISHVIDDIDMSPTAAAAVRALAKQGYHLGYEVEGVLLAVTFEELEKMDFNLDGTFMIFQKDGIGGFKGSIRMYRAVEGSVTHPEAANVYIFVEGTNINGVIRAKNISIEYRGVS